MLDPIDRLVFLGLISLADDYGRCHDNSKVIDAFVFPSCSGTVRESLAKLSGIGRIRRGVSASGKPILEIVNWSKHQRVDKPQKHLALPQIKEIAGNKIDSGIVPELVANDSGTIPDRTMDLGSGTRDLETTFLAPSRTKRSLDAGPGCGLIFSVIGSDPFELPQSKFDEWQTTFVGLDVKRELMLAEQWLRDNPARRKTSRGIVRFLSSWLTRVQDRGRFVKSDATPIDQTKLDAKRLTDRKKLLFESARSKIIRQARIAGRTPTDSEVDSLATKLAEEWLARESESGGNP
jgi:hypothetical protein